MRRRALDEATLDLDLGLPRRRRDEALAQRRRRRCSPPGPAGRWASAPRTGRLSGSKVQAGRDGAPAAISAVPAHAKAGSPLRASRLRRLGFVRPAFP